MKWLLPISACAVVAGCISFDEPDSFDSIDPAGRMHAAGKAASSGDQSAVPELIEMLASDDAAERLVAIGALERLTGERMGYEPSASPSYRRASIERWRSWAARRRAGGVEPATVSANASPPTPPTPQSPLPPPAPAPGKDR